MTVENIITTSNTTAISVTNIDVILKNSIIIGSLSSPSNTGIAASGATSTVVLLANAFRQLSNAAVFTNGALLDCQVRILMIL